MIVILLGPPGVGKGTQAVLLCEGLGLSHLSTGDLLRQARREGTPLGQEAQRYMDRGELVPDDVIVGVVREALADLDDGVVLDGFPRTVAQAEALDEVLAEVGKAVDHVILLEAEDEVLLKRLSGRRSCPECGAVYNVHYNPPAADGVCDRCGAELVHRADDQPETVAHRLEVYREQTAPLVAHFRGHPAAFATVAAARPVEAVQAEIRDVLEA